MDQRQINAAMAAYLDNGDFAPWQAVLDAIKAGEVTVRAGRATLVIKAEPDDALAHLGRRLRESRKASGLTLQQIADTCGMSLSSVSRIFAGVNVTQWPTVHMIVQTLGEDPDDYRVDFEAARRSMYSPERRSHR